MIQASFRAIGHGKIRVLVALVISYLATVSLLHGESVVETFDGGSSSWWNVLPSPELIQPAVQWFTVPEGYVGTSFEMLLEKGSNANSEHVAVVQVYTSSHILVGQTSMSASDFTGSSMWLVVEKLGNEKMSLQPGRYYAVAFTNQSGFNTLHAQLKTGSLYEDGYAAVGFKGGSPLGSDEDFVARLTIVPSP